MSGRTAPARSLSIWRVVPRRRLLVSFKFHQAPDCSRFQFETATETFFGNVPIHPVDFATLEIEIQKAPAIIRGRFCFADTHSSQN
jgi:hypothetical protein